MSHCCCCPAAAAHPATHPLTCAHSCQLPNSRRRRPRRQRLQQHRPPGASLPLPAAGGGCRRGLAHVQRDCDGALRQVSVEYVLNWVWGEECSCDKCVYTVLLLFKPARYPQRICSLHAARCCQAAAVGADACRCADARTPHCATHQTRTTPPHPRGTLADAVMRRRSFHSQLEDGSTGVDLPALLEVSLPPQPGFLDCCQLAGLHLLLKDPASTLMISPPPTLSNL